MPRPITFRELVRRLRAHDGRSEIYHDRGKGSHRMIYHPDVNGRAESLPVPCHHDGEDVRIAHLLQILRRFHLPVEILDPSQRRRRKQEP